MSWWPGQSIGREPARLIASKDATRTEKERAASLADEIVKFLLRAQATGSRLDLASDREAAQSVIDYWTATLFTLPNGLSAAHALPSMFGDSTVGGINLQLAEFDAGTIRDAIKGADAWLQQSPSEVPLARWILLRLVRLHSDKPTFDASPLVRAALYDLDTPERVNSVVAALASRGVVRVTKGEAEELDRITLRSPRLLSEWGTLKQWLDSRLSFRDRVNQWGQAGGPKDQLATGDNLEEARRFHDRNRLEREYVNASAYHQAREVEKAQELRRGRFLWRLLFTIAAAGWLGTALISWGAFTEKRRADTQTQLAVDRKMDIERQQQLTDLRLLVRTLAEVVTTRTDVQEHELALERWDNLVKQINTNDAYASLRSLDLQALRKEATQPKKDITLSGEAMAQIRSLRTQLLQGGDITSSLELAREQSFAMVTLSATGIVETLKRGETIGSAEPYVREFWTQYWGEMLLVEGPTVAGNMVQFGEVLLEIMREVEKSEAMTKGKEELSTFLRGGEKELHEKVQQLNAASLSQFKREYQNIPNQVLQTVLTEVGERTVSEPLVNKLEKRLGPLLNALEEERGKEIPTS